MKLSAALFLMVAASISNAIAHADTLQETGDDGSIYARWGSGKFKIDDNKYHRDVKPQILAEFRKTFGNFGSLCGSNPDFFVEKDGTVYPAATDKKLKEKGTCKKSKFSINMATLLERYVGKT